MPWFVLPCLEITLMIAMVSPLFFVGFVGLLIYDLQNRQGHFGASPTHIA